MKKIKLPAYRRAWEYNLSIEGMYNSTCSVEILVVNEFKQEVFYHYMENVDGKEARSLAIDFCKKYKVSRDDMFFLRIFTLWMQCEVDSVYIDNKEVCI